MDETEIIETVERFYTGKFNTKDVYNLINDYCMSIGKDINYIKSVFKLIQETGISLEQIEHIIYHYIEKYDLITIHNKEGKFIKVFKNEKVNNKTVCNN